VLSHGSAAALLGFARRAPARAHVTVPRSRCQQRRGLVVHAARDLDPRDVTEVDGIPVTTGPRTLLDRAAQLGRDGLDRELATARRLGLAPTDRVRDVLARHPRRAGGPALAAALLGPFTRSELEDRFLALLAAKGLALPRCNVPLLGYEADCVWDEARLVVELDGRATHGVTAQLARDAAKDAAFRAAGWQVERLTWWDVVRDGRRTVDLVGRVSRT
jgi:very-short-patch-repair endonuclease